MLAPVSPLALQPGDIAACYGVDWTSWIIRYGTASLLGPRELRSPPSHVAICCRVEEQTLWVESTTLCSHPCLIRKRSVTGVQAHRPIERIRDYVQDNGRVDLYRLTDINRLSNTESQLLSRILLDYFVRRDVRYDISGALLSGTRMFQHTRLFPGADLERLFCSELIAAVLMRLARMNHDNPTRFHPGRLLRQLVRTGKYHRIASYHRSTSCVEC
ncbi:MAG: hypothetical protein KDA86_15525 [Planctomycetaceae bacterium]|nr:hypothetical protein [Planctomycetaceae bacterium]